MQTHGRDYRIKYDPYGEDLRAHKQSKTSRARHPIVLQKLSPDQLLLATAQAVRQERLSTAEVVRHLQEISDRKLYLERGFSSLFDMVTRHFGYCASSAQRRIQSMRLVQQLPEVEAHLESGDLTLTAAASLQSLFCAEAKEDKQSSREEKLAAVQACLQKSTRDVERELAKRNPTALKRETTRVIAEDRFSLHFSVSAELEEKISRLKALLSHKNPKMENEELLQNLVDIALEKLDPVKKALRREVRGQKAIKPKVRQALQRAVQSSSDRNSLPAQVARTRYIPAAEKGTVWRRNGHRGCEFVDSRTGRKCGSRHLLQMDHITPFSWGGENMADNLRVLCSQHNRLVWNHGG